MARVLALVADLLFGSQVQGALTAAGHDVELIGGGTRLRERLADTGSPRADVLVVDLTDAGLDGAAVVESLGLARARAGAGAGAPAGPRTLGFYSHVDVAARERAERAGFDLVVPRSRMAREGSQLVTRLASPA
jgi:DNA-binding NarL/FixJ family response regulator